MQKEFSSWQPKRVLKETARPICIGVFKLGTSNMEFIVGETDNDREYKAGDEVTYIYSADYTSDMQNALNWLNSIK